MKLSDITLPISYEWGYNHALLFSVDFANKLKELYTQVGKQDCEIIPVKTIDNRYMLTADILTAIENNGYLCEVWKLVDINLYSEIEIVPIIEVLSLLSSNILPE